MTNHAYLAIPFFIVMGFSHAPVARGGTADAPARTAEQIETDWRVQEARRLRAFAALDSDPRPNVASAALALDRGRKLAEDLRLRGVDAAENLAALDALGAELAAFPENAPNAEAWGLHKRARALARSLALRNPLLDFDDILFVKRQPGMLPHLSDQYYGWWSRPGGGLYILRNFKDENPVVECLTEGWPEGSFLRPDLSHDGKRVLFAYCRYYPEVAAMEKVDKTALPEDAFYHIYEINLTDRASRRLTRGRYDDFDARYLPDGGVVFLSTRKGQFVQLTADCTKQTLETVMPDSYVRCGGDNVRPCAVYTLHRMNGDGSGMIPISAFETFEYNPSIANDGRILYTRWDYIDRFNGHFFSLWSARQDGSNPVLVYGNYTTRPQAAMEARSVPGSNKILFTASAHHSHNGGSLVLLDPAMGNEGFEPLTRLTPEVPFPETEANVDSYYASPYPLSETYGLAAWSHNPLAPHWGSRPVGGDLNPPNAMGIYLYDAFGNLELLHRDPELSGMDPIPLRPRETPPAAAAAAGGADSAAGEFLLTDVYQGLGGIARGTVKHIRVIGVPPKIQPHMDQPAIGVSKEDPGKFVLGTAPVEADGSAYFLAPTGVPVFFQALDAEGMAVQTMRSLTYVQPGETLSCIGCHESRYSAPSSRKPLAAERAPSRLRPGPPGSWPLDYGHLVQPVLDRACAQCHAPGSGEPGAADFDLTAGGSYDSLLSYADGDLRRLAFEKDRSLAGECAAANSQLIRWLNNDERHKRIELTAEDWDRLITWMDVYAHYSGSFGPGQERQLARLREELRGSVLAE